MNTRRQFLITASMGAIGSSACRPAQSRDSAAATAPPATPGAPPTFGTGPVSGPPVTPATFAEAEKLVQVTMTPAQREMAAASWRVSMAPLLERRSGPRKVALDDSVAPASRWNPLLPGVSAGPARDRFVRSNGEVPPLPSADAD